MASTDETIEIIPLDTVAELVNEIVVQENLINPSYKIKNDSEKGDGYTSAITIVEVYGKNKVLSILIKRGHPKETLRKLFEIRILFLQEIRFYQNILPALKAFQIKRGVKHPFNSTPICYKTIDSENNELLVLENLKENGFKLFDKRRQMDRAHVEMVLRLYGHLHAISFSMKEHDIKLFEEITKNLGNPFQQLTNKFHEVYEDLIGEMILLFDKNSEPDVHRSISNLKGTFLTFCQKIDNYNGENAIIVHGDCWCNNMMFEYGNGTSTSPTDMRIFDFQFGTLTTPVHDLSYFFYVSASQDMLDNLDYYLQIYHNSLREHMLEMGSDVDKHFPYSALKEEWNQYAKFGLLMTLCTLRLILRDDDKIVESGDEITTVKNNLMNNGKNFEIMNERCRQIGLHFYNNEFI